jgi:hypothetical protein
MAAEKTFTLRFSLSAEIPEALLEDDDFDERAWLSEWETAVKPRLIRQIFGELRSFPDWEARVRNRGISPEDEVEVVVTRKYPAPPQRTLQ